MSGHISEEQISAWVDRQLNPAEMGRVEGHVRGCGECRATAEEYSAMMEVFRSADVPELRPFVWSRIAASLDNPPSPRRAGLRAWLLPAADRRIWIHARAMVLAVMVLAMGGVLFVEYRSSVDSERLEALAEIQFARDNLAALGTESYNPFRTTGSIDVEENPFSRDQLRPDVNPFRSVPRGR